VSEGLLDGVLGLFGGDGAAETALQAAPAFDAAELAARYAAVAGVGSVGVFAADGRLLAHAGAEAQPEDLAARQPRAAALLQAGRTLLCPEEEGVSLASFEAGGAYVVLGLGAGGVSVALRLDSSALVPVMIGRLRRDLTESDG